MKNRKFILENILKFREHLEKEQISRFRDALGKESAIDKALTNRRKDLEKLRFKRDNLLTSKRLDINRIKTLQEEILFTEIDEDTLDKNLVKAKDTTESERKAWVNKKSEKDAIKKLKEKHGKAVEKEMIKEEQKEIDDIAIQKHKEKE